MQPAVLEIQPGGTSETLIFPLDLADIGDAGLMVLVDDEAGVEVVPECVENNNEASVSAGFCGGDTAEPAAE
jgi:hypothetical protein